MRTSRESQDYSDTVLLQLLRENSEWAFTIIYERYIAMLYTLSFRYLKNKEMAEDAVHYVYCKLWEQRSVIEVTTSLKNYLYTAVKNYILNEIRNNNLAVQKNYEMAQSKPTYEDEIFNNIVENQERDLLHSAIESLPEQKRRVCLLKLEGKFSNQEIANIMNLSVPTVKSHYVEAIKILRNLLKKRWIILLIGLLFLQ